MVVFGLGKDLLFKSVLGRCEPGKTDPFNCGPKLLAKVLAWAKIEWNSNDCSVLPRYSVPVTKKKEEFFQNYY